MRSLPFQTRIELRRQTAAPVADTGFASGDYDLRIPAIVRLPAIWWQRACFRTKLRADLKDSSDFLRDIGIDMHEAQAEVWRFFWEPILLKRR
jgi:uncharacterized protein YjiS (DUF1127 family)